MWQRIRVAFLQLKWVAPAIYAIGLLLFTADYVIDQYEAQTSSSHRLPAFLRSVDWYRTVTKAGYRKPRVHFVRLVTFARGREPSDVFPVPGNEELTKKHLCEQRRMMAMLLTALKTSDPALIVIDKFFRATTCPANDEGTTLLQTAVNDVSASIPVIVGEDDVNEDDLRARNDGELTELQQKGFNKADVLLEPTLDLGDRVQRALLNVDWGASKIPLQWRAARESEIGSSGPLNRLTLSMAAAKQYDLSSQARARFEELLRQNRHPYTSLIPQKEFPEYSVIDLICERYTPGLNWKERCRPGLSASGVLKGHIVVIGEYSPGDTFRTEIGPLPGVLLQANYIESILDDRYFKAFYKWAEFGIGFLWFVAVWVIFERTQSPLRALTYCVALSAVLWWILFYFLVEQWGFYLTVAAPGLFLLFGKAIESVVDKLKHKEEKHA